MARLFRQHRAFAARGLAIVLFLLTALLAIPLASPNLADDPPPSEDLDGDNAKDKIEPDPNPPGDSPGEVEIRSGTNGTLIVRIVGQDANDRFGFSVAVVEDINLDGFKDLLVGAPRALDSGRAYVFLGPLGEGPLVITAESADLTLSSPNISDLRFGDRVASVADVNDDGATDLRIRAWVTDAQGIETPRTYVFAGSTGQALFEIDGVVPFDPWLEVQGDTDDDGDVDQKDQQAVISNLGLTGDPGTLSRSEGDLSGDGFVDGVDLALVNANAGANAFAAMSQAQATCPPALPTSDRCILCDGMILVLSTNIFPRCPPCEPQQVTVYQSNGTGGGDWFNPNTWIPHGIPGTLRHFDVVRILAGDTVTQSQKYTYTLGFYLLEDNSTHVFASDAEIAALSVECDDGRWLRAGEMEPIICVRNAREVNAPRHSGLNRVYDCPTFCLLLANPCDPFRVLATCVESPCMAGPP